MKKIFGIICVVLSLSGCEYALDAMTGKDVYDHIKEPPMKFRTLSEAGIWIADNVSYRLPSPYEWQSPYQTMTQRSGGCVDYVTLLLWYAVKEFGKSNCYLLGIEEYDGAKHALCVIEGVAYEAQTFTVRKKGYAAVLSEQDLDEVLNNIYYIYGNRSVNNDSLKFE